MREMLLLKLCYLLLFILEDAYNIILLVSSLLILVALLLKLV